MYLPYLETIWPIEKPLHFSPLQGGTNNQIWKVETVDAQSYVLRLIPDKNYTKHIRYEAAILQALSKKSLPFLLPIPIRTRTGDSIGAVEQENGETLFAVMTPLLPGYLPDRNDPTIAANAGVVLAQLDSALAELSTIEITEGVPLFPIHGDLAHCHPLIPDPLAVIEQLPIDRQQATQMRHFLVSVMQKTPDLYANLPQQFVHRDYDPSNILVDGQCVTAVLDFEFVGFDLRIRDLCVALSWWPVDVMGTGKEWELIDVLVKAYIARFPLSEEELRAIPDVFRLRDATSFVHRTGSYLAGKVTDEGMQRRVRHSLWREEWLVANRETLVQCILEE